MYFAHIHCIPTNPPGYTHLQTQQLATFFAFFLSNPTPICVSHVLASMKSFAGGCQPNPSAVHARMLFFIFYRYFEVNYILCELMSTVDLSCPGSTSSERSSLISGTYNLSVLCDSWFTCCGKTLYSAGSVTLCLWPVVSFCVNRPTAWRSSVMR